MRKLSEAAALARLQRAKVAYQSHIKINYEPRARDCAVCPTPGVCCTDAHFVNVHITRLEAVAIRETLRRTPRLTEEERRAVYARARQLSVTSFMRRAILILRLTRARCSSRASGALCIVGRNPRRAFSMRAMTIGRTCRPSRCSGERSAASSNSTRKLTARRGGGCPHLCG